MLDGFDREAARRSAMAVLVEVVCSESQAEPAQTIVDALCKEDDGLLIGRRFNEWTHKVLLIAQVPHMANMRKYAMALTHARQQNVIESFRYVSGDLIHISFNPSVNPREQMRDFPLRPEESWFLAIHDAHQVYVSLSMPYMLAKQAAWLLTHAVEWAFE